MLARPIIILSEDVVRNKRGEPISPNDIFGIYLPLLKSPSECFLQPIVLAYDQSHFCPLINTDEEVGPSTVSYLPLYQSLEHARQQKLLPIKFLQDDPSQESIHRLLHEHLHIRKLSHSFEPELTQVPVHVAELGKANMNDRHNFFLLYHEYVKDFFATQKRVKLQEEEAERKSQEPDYYRPVYATQSRPFSSTENTAAPPSYSSVIGKTDERKSSAMYERRLSYDKAVENGTLNGSPPRHYLLNNPSSNPAPTYISTTHLDLKPSYSAHTESRDVKHYQNVPDRPSASNFASEDLMSHSPVIINGNSNPRANQSKLKQGTFALSLMQPVGNDR